MIGMSLIETQRGRGGHRIIKALELYCRGQRVDEWQWGDGKVTRGSCLIAWYDWVGETDVPHFDFFVSDRYKPDVVSEWRRNQYILKPWMNVRVIPHQILYIVQEIRKRLTIFHADQLIWIRDEYEDGWESGMGVNRIKEIVTELIEEHGHGYINPTDEIVKHLALSSVYELTLRD